ncbi:MATE family efflux transporter [Sporolactobacillus shoreae]|uniref:Probable multidrug resistance protein NorM n=1 Tax=Sporolactobacillus shoreae TaxID=1465501 RepID=A0A4Z0GHM1_9BACL|nr:MATE family efflux transporter [Sporolactobacillus shoreae]TGA96221.1 MATE family efflux transporter [Sporolactobacillus shoreae]
MATSFQTYVKSLNQLAIPLIANSIFGLSIELVDQAMIAHLSVAAYASVGAIGNFLYTIGGIIGAVAITLNIYGSKAIGEKQKSRYLNYLSSSLLLDVLLGVGLGIFCFIGKDLLLIRLYGFSGISLQDGNDYLSLMSGYFFLQLVIFTLTNCLKINKNTKWILIVSTTTTLLHTCLNYLLIFGVFGYRGLGVSGAAISSTITLCLDAGAYAFLLRNDIKSALHFPPAETVFILLRSLPLMGQELLEGSVFIIILNALLAHISPLILSGYLLISQILQIGLVPTFMYSSALLTLVSESNGARNQSDLKDFPRTAGILAMILFCFIGILFYSLRVPIASLITNDTRLIRYSANIFLILWLANVFRPLFEIYKSALQSVGQSRCVLKLTCVVNTITLVLMIILIEYLKLYGVAIGLLFNYFVIFLLLNLNYSRYLSRQITLNS